MSQQSNTPFTARSVLASAMLGMDPPELGVAQLVRLAGLFEISENRARVALSRMVAAGEATTNGSGRYRLSGHLVERQSRQSASRSGVRAHYSGTWLLAVVTTTGSTAEVRSHRRRALTHLRLAELREGVWLRPDNLAAWPSGDLLVDIECMEARPGDAEALVERLWDLEDWSARANALVAELESVDPDSPASLGPGFTLSAAVLRHLQADPLLPDELLPPSWPGSVLRTGYDHWDLTYRSTLAKWSSDSARR